MLKQWQTGNNVKYLTIFFMFLVSNILMMISEGIYYRYNARNKIKIHKFIKKMKINDL